MFCILVLVTINLFATTKLLLNAREVPSPLHTREPLPCKAVPTRFVIEEPECANKLLRSMNVTNVHILPAAPYDYQLNRTISRLQTLSETLTNTE